LVATRTEWNLPLAKTINPSPTLTDTDSSSYKKQKWAISADAKWLWEQFDEAFFLFNPLSNETHILNSLTVDTLKILKKQSMTLSELFLHLGMEPLEKDVILPYQRLLHELDRLGLIAPVES
jgi:PqqD family protein of HPr-rel-A system